MNINFLLFPLLFIFTNHGFAMELNFQTHEIRDLDSLSDESDEAVIPPTESIKPLKNSGKLRAILTGGHKDDLAKSELRRLFDSVDLKEFYDFRETLAAYFYGKIFKNKTNTIVFNNTPVSYEGFINKLSQHINKTLFTEGNIDIKPVGQADDQVTESDIKKFYMENNKDKKLIKFLHKNLYDGAVFSIIQASYADIANKILAATETTDKLPLMKRLKAISEKTQNHLFKKFK